MPFNAQHGYYRDQHADAIAPLVEWSARTGNGVN
jgi:hypothetical protein